MEPITAFIIPRP